MTQLLLLLVGAALSAMGGFVARLRGLRHEELGKRFDDLCKDIDAASNAATEYWLKPGSEDLRVFETKLMGFQHGISQGLKSISDDHHFLEDACENEVAAFFEALTGGDFQVQGRAEDPSRALDAQIAGRSFIAHVRRQRQDTLRWWPISGI